MTTDQKAAAAIATLERLGYTHTGGELWRGPLGKVPNFDLVDRWRAKADELSAQVEALTKYIRPVYLVATGEVHEGQETYTRHDAPVPMADQEVLFTRPPEPLTQPAVPDWTADVRKVLEALDPDDWCGDEPMMVVLNRALATVGQDDHSLMLAAAPQPPVAVAGPVPVVISDDQIAATAGRLGGFSESRPLSQQWDNVYALVRKVIQERGAAAPQPEVQAYAPLTPDEVRDLTCMQAGAPWADATMGALAEVIAIYEQLRREDKRPVDPATQPKQSIAELRASALKHHNEYMSKASEPIQYDLYWRLESLSKSLESCDRIDSHDNPDAYATILDAMNYVRGIKP